MPRSCAGAERREVLDHATHTTWRARGLGGERRRQHLVFEGSRETPPQRRCRSTNRPCPSTAIPRAFDSVAKMVACRWIRDQVPRLLLSMTASAAYCCCYLDRITGQIGIRVIRGRAGQQRRECRDPDRGRRHSAFIGGGRRRHCTTPRSAPAAESLFNRSGNFGAVRSWWVQSRRRLALAALQALMRIEHRDGVQTTVSLSSSRSAWIRACRRRAEVELVHPGVQAARRRARSGGRESTD